MSIMTELIKAFSDKKITEKEFELGIKKIMSLENVARIQAETTPVSAAKRIAELREEMFSCEECARLQNTALTKAIKSGSKIGSVQEQIERGERFIIKNPYSDYYEIMQGKTFHPCKIHRKNALEIIELRRVTGK